MTTTTYTDPLAGYFETIRSRKLLLTRQVDGITLYHVGFGEFSTDRDAAMRYDPDNRRLRGETTELA